MKKITQLLFNRTSKFIKASGLIVGALMVGYTAQGQVQYQLEWNEAAANYQVSLVSNTTYSGYNKITATAQVTIKVPTGQFDVYNLKSLQNDADWEANSHYIAPDEAPEYDYISFGLKSLGTKSLSYQKDTKIPLFSFENAEGCTGAIALVDIKNDVFMPPNSRKANIGNQITIFGAGGNAYQGNIDDGTASCQLESVTALNNISNVLESNVYPSPARDNINIDISWGAKNEQITLLIFDINGKKIKQKTHTLVQGKNTLKFDINTLEPGTYSIEIRGKNRTETLQNFLKL